MIKQKKDKWMVVWLLLRNHETEAVFCTREEAINFIIDNHEEDPLAVRAAFQTSDTCNVGNEYEIEQFSLRLDKYAYVSRDTTPQGRLFFM